MTSPLVRRAGVGLAVLGAIVALFFLSDALTHRHPRRLIPQAGANLAIVLNPSFADGLSKYPHWWPPLYPTVLEGLQRLGVPPMRANSLLYAGLVVLVAAFVRRRTGWAAAAGAALLLASSYPNSYNVGQVTAETLFALEAFVVLVLLAGSGAHPSTLRIVLASVVCGAAGLTRFFGIAWPTIALPLAIATAERPWRWRITRLALAGAVVVAVILPWLVHLHDVSGHWFGSDRKEAWQAGEIAGWNDLRGPGTNVRFTLKTLAVDFFSPTRLARHEVVNKLPVTPAEWTLTGLAASLLLVPATTLGRRARSRPAGAALLRRPDVSTLFFAVSFLVATIVVWSTSNNDPIYSRFLYPGYPFLVASLALAAGPGAPMATVRLPVALVGLLVLGASLLRWAAT